MRRWRTDGFAGRNAASRWRLRSARSACGLPAGSPRRQPLDRHIEAFRRQNSSAVGDYMRNEIATGKIPGAIVLIQQHGRPSFSKILACATSRASVR